MSDYMPGRPSVADGAAAFLSNVATGKLLGRLYIEGLDRLTNTVLLAVHRRDPAQVPETRRALGEYLRLKADVLDPPDRAA